jgi:hypothetical protein
MTVTPTLLVDVDGVLNPYGIDEIPLGFRPYVFFPEDEEPVLLADIHANWLQELSLVFDMVWATGWGEKANQHIGPLFRLPPWPTISFPPIPFHPAEKVPAIDRFIGNTPCAWLEDLMTPEAIAWAAARTAPTLLIDVDPTIGLTRHMVDRLINWAAALSDSHPAYSVREKGRAEGA